MKLTKKSAVCAFSAAALAGGMFFVGAANASAAAPTFTPDADSSGSVLFFDAAGNQITSGSLNDAHFAAYYEATSPFGPLDGAKATVDGYTPVAGQHPIDWQTSNPITSSQASSGTHPGFPGALATTNNPVVKDDDGVNGLKDQTVFAPASDPANPNVYEIRLFASDSTTYWATDVLVNTSTNTWTQVFPTVKTSTSFSAISASPTSPAPHGSSVTLSSTLTAADGTHPAGTVTLLDGSTPVTGVTFNAATGAVSANVSPADGSHSYTFAFAPTDTTTYNTTTSAALAYTVNAPAPAAATTTAVSGPTTGTVGSPVTEHANVTSGAGNTEIGAGAGSVQFLVDGVANGSSVALTATGADFSYIPADTAAHVVTAKFIPANVTPAVYLASQDGTGVTVTATAPAYAPDPQTLDVNVKQGSLVISTPYTPANPLHLGDMVLSADGTSLVSTPANFGDPTKPATAIPGVDNGVTITDTRTGSTGWTASAAVTDFTNGANSIDGNGLSFTGVTPAYITGNAIQSGVTTNDITGFKSAAKSFATTHNGPGTVDIKGKVTLTAPTSTLAGLYTATMTFTIV